MSASITPFGTSRSVYSFANSDIEINGNVNANQFIGDGQNITNINIDNINNANVNFNKKLIKNIGGTGNSTYIDKGIVFNNNSTDKFDTTSNLYWDYNENILYINKKNIVETFSSYTDKSSNSIIETIKNTSNNIIKEIKNTIQSNIFIENVQGIPKGSKTNYGIYKVGEGIFVNNGVLSIAPAPIVIKEPSVEPKLIPSIIEDTTYEKFIFKYDPNRGTTFEVNDNSILQYHFNFNEITDVNNNIKSIGIQKNNIIINNITNVFLEPTINKKYEYTPLDNNYLYFDGELNSFAQFDSNFNMYNIYSVNLIEGGPEIGITFSFWFKTHSFIHVDKFLFSFSNSNINTYRFEIKIIKSGEFNHLAVNIRQGTDNEHIISDVKIYINTWYHFVWTIDGNQYPTWGLYVNYQNNPNQIYEKLLFNRIGIAINSDYSIKNIGKATHKSNTNLRFSISDIRIYNKVLNKTDITELYKLDEYTQYKISFNDPNYTTCDILLIGGGGGGTNEGGGGAGELIFIDNAIFEEKEYVIKVGRGGAGRVTEIINGNNTILQKNTKGINTVFGNIIVNGGGSASVLSGKGGSGSGNGGTLKLNTNVNDFNYRKIYFKGNDGYQINGGGGGSGSIGKIYDGGDGIGTIEDIINNTTYNFGELFDLLNDDDIGYYNANSDLIFFAGGGGSNINNSYGGLGGGGDGSSDYIENINYKGQKNTGSGGGGYNNHGYSGGSGIVLLRYLQTEIISSGIGNQLIITSNNLLSKINALTTDNIIQQNNNNKKFIIDNVYDNDLLLNGSLTINSNLIIHGETTIFNTDIYISEKVNISNYDSDTALHVKQFGNILPDFNNIFIIDYNESRLFTISDNGNVGVGVLPQLHNLLDVKGNINIVSQLNKDFKFTINNRDIIRDTSNYTSRTSNILISDYNTKFQYASNYILETSNFHRIDYDTKFHDASNYILETSNFHRIDYDTKFHDASNYILGTSNFHRIDYDTKFQYASNYILGTSNFHRIDYDTKFKYASNYILETSNFHRIDYDTKFHDASNYILETSNVISSRITNLNADSIADGIINKFINNKSIRTNLNADSIADGIINKFIINNKYENDLEIIGDLKASNLIIYGENTYLYTDIYTTEQLSVENNGLGTAFNVKQLNSSYSIFNASNSETEVFTILNEGNVGIGGIIPSGNNLLEVRGNVNIISHLNEKFKFTINNRDIIRETSNYILETSNFHRIDYDTKFQYASNYILETSNFHRIDYDTKFQDASNYILETSNFHRIDYDTKFQDASNYILETSNFHRIDYDTKFQDASNYILETSNFHRIDYDTKFQDASNYILETSNFYRIDYDTKFQDASNYILETSNFHRIDYDTKFQDASNYILETSNFHRIDYDTKFHDASNYILETSNFHRIDYDTKFQYASNYILETSNLISSIITYLTTDNIADGNTNKFIVSGKYDGNIEIKGDLITSNITIIGEKTSLVNNIFKTEVLELSNNGIDTAIKVIQLNPTYDIFNAYNNTENVFTILGNGNIGIGEKNPLVKLEINGDVNIYSNLYVNGTETIINTKLKAKNILIENNTLEKALTIKQSIGNDILSVSNINREVLTIKNDGRIGINNASPENTLDVYGNINATSYTHNGYPLSLEFSQGMIIQTKHLTYSKTEIKNGNDWEPINNDINNGFVIAIKPSDITSKILISTVCHIGMEYETDSRWWGIRLYRKIGNGTWTHISNANGIIDNNENGTSCWISHNLGADSSTYSHFITNITGSYQDTPNTTEIVYYTAYWKNRVGELSDGLLYLNKSSYTLDNNYPRPSSSWTATEIWNKGVSYIAPLQSTQIQINTQYNSVGIDTSPPTEVHKLKVNGSINIIDGTYNMNGYDIMQNISNFILNTSNILIQKINELLNRIELLENN